MVIKKLRVSFIVFLVGDLGTRAGSKGLEFRTKRLGYVFQRYPGGSKMQDVILNRPLINISVFNQQLWADASYLIS